MSIQRSILTMMVVLSGMGGISCLAAEERPWFERSIVGMEIGPTGAQFGYSDLKDARYCARFDGREIVRHAIKANSEYLVLWVRDGDYAYYDSKLLPKAPGLGSRDPLREAVDEAKTHRLPLIAYCVVQQGGHFLKAHPEWEMHGADGKPIGRFCYNSGYLDAMKAILAEQLAYGIDGFHIDMLDQGFGPPYGCWCPVCRRQFEQQCKRPMPTGLTWDEAWDDMLEFRYRSSQRFEKALGAHVKSINPRATVDFNYHGNPPFSFEVGQRPVQHAGNGDFVTGETGVWGFSALGVGLNAQFYRASTPGFPYQVAIQRGVRMYHDQTTRPLNDIRWELFTLLSHGAFVTTVDKTGFDGRLDPVAYERIGAAFKEALTKRPHFGHQPVCEVGLYFSSRTRDWVGRETPANYFQAFQGAHKIVVLEHLPFGILFDENVTLEALRRFSVVWLPNAAILSNGEVALFRRFVEEGGKLLVTGQTGQFDRMGRPLKESVLSRLIGATVKERPDSLDNWVQLPVGQHLLAQGIDHAAAVPFLVKGPATVYAPTTAKPFGQLLKPHRTMRQMQGKEGTEWPMSADAAVGPAVLVNEFGRGVVLTIAASPDYASASDHHIVEARRLLANAVRLLNSSPRIRISGPANVETVVTEDSASRTLRIHFIAYNATPQTTPAQNRPYVLPGLIEDAPIFKSRITLAQPPRQVQLLNPESRLDRMGNTLDVTIHDIHEVLVVRY